MFTLYTHASLTEIGLADEAVNKYTLTLRRIRLGLPENFDDAIFVRPVDDVTSASVTLGNYFVVTELPIKQTVPLNTLLNLRTLTCMEGTIWQLVHTTVHLLER
jgi:hypothetical protein